MIPHSIQPKLIKLLPLLASEIDGEVVSTVRAIGRTLSAAGVDFHDLTDSLVKARVVIPPRPAGGAFNYADVYRQALGMEVMTFTRRLARDALACRSGIRTKCSPGGRSRRNACVSTGPCRSEMADGFSDRSRSISSSSSFTKSSGRLTPRHHGWRPLSLAAIRPGTHPNGRGRKHERDRPFPCRSLQGRSTRHGRYGPHCGDHSRGSSRCW
ncbi:hypothetical protein AIGOOFII_4292 [Methylobacterium marchantiae]|nr:hypothetical protein AIGOOFII_4292 [Methylobacterium marchantiae]